MLATRTRFFLLLLVVLSLGTIALIAWLGGQPRATEDAELAAGREVPAGETELETLPPREMTSREEAVSIEPAVADELETDTPPPTEGFGSIRGRVVDGNGSPIPSFTIAWCRERESGFEQRSFEVSTGRFEVGPLPWGRWEVLAMAGDRGGSERVATLVPHLGEIELVCGNSAVISGTVRRANGLPAPRAEVSWRGERALHKGQVQSGPDGRYRLEKVRGKLYLDASWEDQVTAKSLQFRGNTTFVHEFENLDLQLVLGGRLTVVVLDGEGRPDPGRQILLEHPSPGRWSPNQQRRAQVDRLGEHDFGLLPPGLYQLSAEDPGRASVSDSAPAQAAPEATRITSVQVIAGETIHVVLGGRSGQQVAVHGLLTRAGNPVEGEVTAFPEGLGALRESREAKSDREGRFEMILEVPGAYSFQIKRRGRGGVTRSVTIPAVESYDLHLELPDGSLSGQLFVGDEPAGRGFPVELQMSEAINHLGSERIALVETDSEGRWAFDGLAAGTYSIFATYPGSGDGNPLDMGAARLERIRLGEEERIVNLRLEWSVLGMVRFRVTDHDGRPVEGAAVFARDVEGEWVDSSAKAFATENGWGGYLLPAGRYTLMARTGDALSPESGPVDVKALEMYSLNFSTAELQLAPGGGLKAALLDSDGQPIRASFSVRDSEGREQTGTTCSHDRARVLEHGRRSAELWIRPLLPGRFRVTATAPDGRQVFEEIEIQAGADEVLELKLE